MTGGLPPPEQDPRVLCASRPPVCLRLCFQRQTRAPYKQAVFARLFPQGHAKDCSATARKSCSKARLDSRGRQELAVASTSAPQVPQIVAATNPVARNFRSGAGGTHRHGA